MTTRALSLLFGAALLAATGPARAQDALIPGPPGTSAPPGVVRLSLAEAKWRALSQNRDLLLGRLAVQEKSLATEAARTDYFPKVLGSVYYFHFNQNLGSVLTVNRGQFGILPPGTTTRSINVIRQDSTLGSFTVAQPITKLILVNAGVKLAEADTAIARAQLDKGTRDLLSGIAQAFYGLQGARQIETALAMQADYLQQAVRADPKPEMRVSLIEIQQGLLQARMQAADLNEQLDHLLCFPAGTTLLPDDPPPPAAPVGSTDDAARMALACNPQVVEARATLAKARAGLQAANAEFLPDLLVFGSYFNQTAAPAIQENIGAIGVTGSYTFIDWGKRRKVRSRRETQIAQAEVDVRATIDKVVLEARRAFLAYDQAQQAMALASEMARARRDSEAGIKDPLALASARAATAKSGLDQLQAEIAYRVAWAKLAGAIGMEWGGMARGSMRSLAGPLLCRNPVLGMRPGGQNPRRRADSEDDPAPDYDDSRVISARRRAARSKPNPAPGVRIMATQAQIEANRKNARKSTGPKSPDGKDVTKFNGLKHGLRAEQVVLPGEAPADFEAERKAWFDDWRPRSHTRAVLVERAAVASWKLRRATRVEAARLYEPGADAAHEFDLSQKERVENSLHLLPREPGYALARLMTEPAGLDRLIGLWDGLAAAAEPAGWTSRADHHDRLLCLLGHPAGSDPQGLEIARSSLALLADDDPAEGAGAAAELRAFCTEQAEELRRERSGFWDPAVLRKRAIDAAGAPVSKEAQLLHRYEMAHEKSLRSAIRGLLALENSGADLPEPAEPEPGPEVAAPAGPDAPAKQDSIHEPSWTCGELASVGAATSPGVRSGRSAGSPGRPCRPIGADPGPGTAPNRR